jgi:hypothetical protein
MKLSYFIYLCYQTNIELGKEYNISQYIILDYFIGISKTNIVCVPINKRQIILTLMGLEEKNYNPLPITDSNENEYYKIYNATHPELIEWKKIC